VINHNETRTRKQLIDPLLLKAGWDIRDSDKVGIEVPVDGFDPQEWQILQTKLKKISSKIGVYRTDLPEGITDYVLKHPNGQILAVVEAKRTCIDPRLAEAQVEFYVNEIKKRQSFKPFAFMTNGIDTYFWDIGEAPKRGITGFFSMQDLENMLFVRQNKKPLTSIQLNTTITERAYQQEAIQRLCEAFEKGKRKALLVMATGTGKTRTAMSLVDIFMRANQARRILFVADRDALVTQAFNDGFKTYIKDEPCIRLTSDNINKNKRLYAVTLQTLSNIYQEFTPAFFDLIIFDEVHRSIFNKYNEVLEYFDGRMVGLTATPADFIDRNTFLEFECTDGIPTFYYSYDQAIKDGYLVPFDLYNARTQFQRTGIHGVDLSEEERNYLNEQGFDPDEFSFEGTDLEKLVSNKDTLRKQWEEIIERCHKDQSGQFPGKTIIFAMTQEHALRIADVFNEMFPQWNGILKVITYKSEFHGRLIKQLKTENYPRIAITVDMLETGIDIPEVVNLVFMRPVYSRIKLEQMIGRGTRCEDTCHHMEWLPGGHKTKFLIIDFWENDFRKKPNEETKATLPLLVELFNIRLKILWALQHNPDSIAYLRMVNELRKLSELIPLDSFLVRKHWLEIEPLFEENFWKYLPQLKVQFLKNKVGPLLRFANAQDIPGLTFSHKLEKLKLAILEGKDKTINELTDSIREQLTRLPNFVSEKEECSKAMSFCFSENLTRAEPTELDEIMDALADQMKFCRTRENPFILIDLQDKIEAGGFVILTEQGEPIYAQQYRRLVEDKIIKLSEEHPTLQAIKAGREVSDLALLDLERTLKNELGDSELKVSTDTIRKAYGLRVGSLLELLREIMDVETLPDYEDIVRHQFAEFIAVQGFNSNQINFLRAVQTVFLNKRRLQPEDLYLPPLDTFGLNAVEKLFTKKQIKEILEFAEKISLAGETNAH